MRQSASLRKRLPLTLHAERNSVNEIGNKSLYGARSDGPQATAGGQEIDLTGVTVVADRADAWGYHLAAQGSNSHLYPSSLVHGLVRLHSVVEKEETTAPPLYYHR
jgi:hypothetical protein